MISRETKKTVVEEREGVCMCNESENIYGNFILSLDRRCCHTRSKHALPQSVIGAMTISIGSRYQLTTMLAETTAGLVLGQGCSRWFRDKCEELVGCDGDKAVYDFEVFGQTTSQSSSLKR